MNKRVSLPLPVFFTLMGVIIGCLLMILTYQSISISAQSVQDLLVHFDMDGGSSWVNTGNVGIGTIDPQSKLSIINNTDDGTFDGRRDILQIGNVLNNAMTVGLFGSQHPDMPQTVQFGAWNAEQNISLVTDLKSNIESGLSTKGIFIKSGGNVGIGTKDPTQKLHIYSSGITFEDPTNPADKTLLYFMKTGTSLPDGKGYKFSWRNDDGSNRRSAMVFDTSGAVCIGNC